MHSADIRFVFLQKLQLVTKRHFTAQIIKNTDF